MARLWSLAGLSFLAASTLMCAPPADGVDSGDGDGDGDSIGVGNGTGSGGGGTNQNDDIITVPPPVVSNPCEQENAPDNCQLTAPPACGDGEINLDPPEACDDGNSLPGDGCSGACIVEPYYECPTAGEPCVSTISCGDGLVQPGEACDDSNSVDGDGCAADCSEVEPGYSCRLAGEPCVRVFVCGDGVVDPNEGCDPGQESVEGCTDTCRVDIGFKCEGAPSACTPTVCGDGIQEGSESCDDGNQTPFDGCSPSCQAEPSCATGQPCTSGCGDGITLGDEECDDGNLRNGDGCSSDCTVEMGFVCAIPESCTGEGCTLDLPIIYRDFSAAHSDFGVDCGTIQRNVPNQMLSATGKPVLSAATYPDACIASAASFAEWYTDTSSSVELVSNIVLFENESGGYVNRLNNEGDRYEVPPANDGLQWCSNDPDDCAACPAGYVTCHAPCAPWGGNNQQTCAEYSSADGPVYLDGNPLFFPIPASMGAASDLAVASIPEEVYGGGWQEDPSGVENNFYFTSEIAYWFEYTEGMAAELSFVGDDDLWVFVNGHLAVDLGGLHVPVEGRFTLNVDGSIELLQGVDGSGNENEPDTADVGDFNLEPGNVYEVKVFQAERKMVGSSYRLTLSGFNAGASECVTDCGDGEVGPGEECDDGVGENTGGYNKCQADCTLGPHCGDGITQAGEACDYGAAGNIGEYGGCAANCQLGPYCGDGVVSDGEACDDGINDGGYGECAPGCVLGPYCGDGGLQPAYEECDDANNAGGDGCSGACKVEVVVTR